MDTFTKSEDETKSRAKELVEFLESEKVSGGATIVALNGELGAGKTVFTQGIAEAFSIDEKITSPTFVIEKIYKIKRNVPWTHLVHIDAYRLDTETELLSLGWHDLVGKPENFIVLQFYTRNLDQSLHN